MRQFLFFAVAAATSLERKGVEVPGENGWNVTCRMNLDVPPAFALYTDEGDLYFTSFAAIGQVN